VSNLAPRRRLVPAAAVLFLAGACVLARLGFLQVLRHGYYAERAEVNQQERVPLPPIAGGLCLLGGIALLVSASRRPSA